MHPLGMYLAISDSQRGHGYAAQERRPSFARVDATPILEPEPVSRIRRLAVMVRRLGLRAASA